VEQEIRKQYISEYVSQVSSIVSVRKAMVALQQRMGEKKGIVMDGRDIGTVVFPQAEIKIYMTAQPEIRAQRRKAELEAKGEEVSFETILANLKMRDELDMNREEGPLKKAADAIVLDTSYTSFDEQVNFILDLAYQKIQENHG
jgi:cytidylate kinase